MKEEAKTIIPKQKVLKMKIVIVYIVITYIVIVTFVFHLEYIFTKEVKTPFASFFKMLIILCSWISKFILMDPFFKLKFRFISNTENKIKVIQLSKT